jgi:hypothetical protein
MRAVWKHIIPHCANDFIGFETNFAEVTNNTVEIGQQLGFNGFPPLRCSQVGFVMDKVALGQVFPEYFGFPCQSSFHQVLHKHYTIVIYYNLL